MFLAHLIGTSESGCLETTLVNSILMILRANGVKWLLCAPTRTGAKRLLVLIGQKKALGIAVRNDRPQRRYSGLLASLRGTGQQGVIS